MYGKNFAVDIPNALYYFGSVDPVVYKVDSNSAILASKSMPSTRFLSFDLSNDALKLLIVG